MERSRRALRHRQSMQGGARRAAALLVGIWLLAGCAHAAGAVGAEVAGQATPAAIVGAVEAVEDPDLRATLVDLAGTPEVEQAAARLIARLTDGALTSLGAEDRAKRIGDAADLYVEELARSVGKAMHGAIGPEMVSIVVRSVDASLARAMSDDSVARIGGVVDVLTRRTLSTLATALREELRPAVVAMLREDIGPAIRDGLEDPRTRGAIGATTRVMTREVILGMQDAFERIDARHEAGRGRATALTGLQQLAEVGPNYFFFATIGLVLVVTMLIAWLLRSRAKAREAAAESERHEAALLAVATALETTGDKPWSKE